MAARIRDNKNSDSLSNSSYKPSCFIFDVTAWLPSDLPQLDSSCCSSIEHVYVTLLHSEGFQSGITTRNCWQNSIGQFQFLYTSLLKTCGMLLRLMRSIFLSPSFPASGTRPHQSGETALHHAKERPQNVYARVERNKHYFVPTNASLQVSGRCDNYSSILHLILMQHRWITVGKKNEVTELMQVLCAKKAKHCSLPGEHQHAHKEPQNYFSLRTRITWSCSQCPFKASIALPINQYSPWKTQTWSLPCGCSKDCCVRKLLNVSPQAFDDLFLVTKILRYATGDLWAQHRVIVLRHHIAWAAKPSTKRERYHPLHVASEITGRLSCKHVQRHYVSLQLEFEFHLFGTKSKLLLFSAYSYPTLQ